MMMATQSSGLATQDLPAILCLHGQGSNATIYEFQCRRVMKVLSGTFRFVFVEAPFEEEAGTDILPAFEWCEPFGGWVRRRVETGDGPERVEYVSEEEGEKQEVQEALDQAVRKSVGGWERVGGVMGFSQGAQLAAGLVLGQLLGTTGGLKEGGGREGTGVLKMDFKFAVFIGSPFSPLCMDDGVDGSHHGLLKGFPTVHAWGKADPLREACKKLEVLCQGEVCFPMDFDGGHHLPLTDVETTDLCHLIKRAWEAGQKQTGTGKTMAM